MRVLLVLAACVLAVGCDSRAKASDAARADKSKEYESCSASVDCGDGLRCFDRECRRTQRSTVGDYFAALGAQLRVKGDVEGAIDAYDRAVGHYDSEKIGLPPDVDCAYGAALAAGKANKAHAELAARVLHRCVLAVPVGSDLRHHALADLATLDDAGLDPLALGRSSLADVYLTRQPAAPATDKLAVDVKPNPQPAGTSYGEIPNKLAAPELRPALIACWTAYNNATHKPAMSATIGVKAYYVAAEYDDESGYFKLKVDAPAALPAGPDAAADQCVRAAVVPALEDLKSLHDAFSTQLTITVK